VDCGGSTDHRITGLLARHWQPATLTIALSARTTVVLTSYEAGKILVESKDIGAECCAFPTLPLEGPLGLIFAVVGYFGVHGLQITVNAEAPVRSGLGGSAAVTVALIGALNELLNLPEASAQDLCQVVLLAHHLEDGLYDNTGLQDQAAAAYGGVHLWRWQYADQLRFEIGPPVIDPAELASHVVVAYSGKPHAGQRRSSFQETFRKTGNLEPLIRISASARAMSDALRDRDYKAAARALSAEADTRSMFMDPTNPVREDPLLSAAYDHGCGARFAGHGGGGAVWAIGEAREIDALRSAWARISTQRGSGFVFPPGLSPEGLRVIREDG